MKWFAEFRPFLRYSKLKFEINQHGFEVTSSIVKNLKDHSYEEQWIICKQNRWFHLILDDNCFFSFTINPKPSYTFFDCPLDSMPISQFRHDMDKYNYGYARKDLESEYQDYLSTCQFKKSITPIRYDHDPASYRPGAHPAAHIHIGLDNEIRLGVKRELTPLAFLLFIIRQRYPYNWELLLQTDLVKRIEKIVRSELAEIAPPLIHDFDKLELYLD